MAVYPDLDFRLSGLTLEPAPVIRRGVLKQPSSYTPIRQPKAEVRSISENLSAITKGVSAQSSNSGSLPLVHLYILLQRSGMQVDDTLCIDLNSFVRAKFNINSCRPTLRGQTAFQAAGADSSGLPLGSGS